MRFIKVFLIIVMFFVSMVFFAQNTVILSQPLILQFDCIARSWQSEPLPIYFLILCGFLLGALFTLLFFASQRVKLGANAHKLRKQVSRLEKEVNSLRAIPLQDTAITDNSASEENK